MDQKKVDKQQVHTKVVQSTRKCAYSRHYHRAYEAAKRSGASPADAKVPSMGWCVCVCESVCVCDTQTQLQPQHHAHTPMSLPPPVPNPTVTHPPVLTAPHDLGAHPVW